MPRRLMMIALICVAVTPVSADVELPQVISAHMVLQREMPVTIWGTSAPGENITVQFRDQRKSATGDAGGKWAVVLDPMKSGGPDPIKIAGVRSKYSDEGLTL